jgi:hypothetical protein
VHEARTPGSSSVRWVCARCLARLRDEGAFVADKVSAFKEAMQGKATYSMTDLHHLLHDVDPSTVARFVNKVGMGHVIRHDAATNTIHVNEPSDHEIDTLSHRFENWLRFGSVWRPSEEP